MQPFLCLLLMHITDGAQRILTGPLGDKRAGDQPHRGHVSGGEAVRSFWPACRWRPGKRTASRGPQTLEDWSQSPGGAHLAAYTVHQAQLFFSTPGPLRTRARTGWGGIPGGAGSHANEQRVQKDPVQGQRTEGRRSGTWHRPPRAKTAPATPTRDGALPTPPGGRWIVSL